MKTCFVEAKCKVIHFSINNKMFRRKYQYIIVKQLSAVWLTIVGSLANNCRQVG